MADFSVLQGGFSGFRLIARRPLSVATLSLLNLLALGLVLLPTFWLLSYESLPQPEQGLPPSATAPSQRLRQMLQENADDQTHRLQQTLALRRASYAIEMNKLQDKLRDLESSPPAPDDSRHHSPFQLTAEKVRADIASLEQREARTEQMFSTMQSRTESGLKEQEEGFRRQAYSNWVHRQVAPAAPLSLLGVLALFAVQAVGASAIFRGAPEASASPGFLIRLGRTELNVASAMLLLLLVLGGCFVAGVVFVGTFAIAGAAGTWGHVNPGYWELLALATPWVAQALALIVWLVLLLRLGPSLPMAFSEGGAPLGQSWSLTRRRAAPMLGMSALVLLQLGGLAIVAIGLHQWAFGVDAPSPGASLWRPTSFWWFSYWRPLSLADAVWCWACVGLLLGPATALVMAPLSQFYRAFAPR